MSQNVTWNGTSRSIPDAGNVNWPSLTGFLVDLGTNAAVAKQMKQAIRICTTTPVTVSPTSDCTLVMLLNTPGASDVNLPAGVNGQLFILVDGTGDAGTHNITVTPNGSETIQGDPNFVVDHNRQVVIFQYSTTGTRWYVVANVIYPGTITPADIVGIIPASKGGTGVNNNDAATLTRSGNHDLAITTTAPSAVTMPTAGTLATLAGAETLTNKVLNGNTIANFLSAPGETITAPATAGTLATLARAETLTNKTLTAPVINSPTGLVKADVGLGNVDNTSDATKNAAAVTLTNKTIASPTVTGTLLLQNAAGAQPVLALSEDPDNGTNKVQIQAAATMAADYTMTLPNAQGLSGQTMVNDGSGNLSWGAAGGSGQLNLIDNPNDATNWSETGTVFDGSPTTTTTAGDLPLSGIVDTAIKITASGNGTESTNYVSYSFTTPASMSGMLGIYFYMRAGTGFAASEWTVSVYQGTTRQNLTTDSSSVSYIQNIANQYGTAFFANASTAYTLRFARVSGSGSATLNVTDVQVTPGVRAQGSIVEKSRTDLVWTPSAGFGTTSNQFVKTQRIGNEMRVFGRFTAGTVAASVAAISLPTGYAIDSTVLPTNATQRLGVANRVTGSSVNPAGNNMVVFYDGSTTNQVFITVDTTSFVYTKVNVSSPFATSDVVSFDFTIPIAGWAESTNIAQNNVEYAFSTDTTTTAGYVGTTGNFGYGPGGVQFNAINSTTNDNETRYIVRFPTPIQPTDDVSVEVLVDGDWMDMTQTPAVCGRTNQVSGATVKNYGMYLRPSTSYADTDIAICFANNGRLPTGSGYAADGAAWSGIAGSNTYKWRLKKCSAGVPVGFGGATTSITGLWYKPDQITGQNVASASNNTPTDIGTGTVTLQPGVYTLEYGGEVYIDYTAGSPPTYAECEIRITDSANNFIIATVGGLSPTANDRSRSQIHGVYTYTTAAAITLKLRTNLNVTGGASVVRNVQKAYLKALKT